MDAYLPRLHELEELFGYYKLHLAEMIVEQRKLIAQTIVTKGPVANHTPYYHERIGLQVRSKLLNTVVTSRDCYLNHYDGDGRLMMVEEYVGFTDCPFQVNELYRYGDRAERLYLSSERLVRLDEFDHPFADTEISLSFAGANGYIVEEFKYDGGRLMEIQIKRPTMTERHVFRYEDGKLVQILRVCENGYQELVYSTMKPDFARIRRELYTSLLALIEKQGDVAAIGIEGFLDQSQPSVCVSFTGEADPPALIADWGCPMVNLSVYDYQFSESQLRKCVKIIAEILILLVQEGYLAKKGIWFHQNQVCVTEEFSAVRNLCKKAGVEIL